jgi:alpha-N-arabinofuranosidase
MPAISKKVLRSIVLFAMVLMINAFGQNTLTVKVDSAQALVHSEIFGTLMERLGRNWVGGVYVGTNSNIPNTDGMRNDIIQGMKSCGVGLIQWPGGAASCGYNWVPDTNPTNDVGTVQFMAMCDSIGCQPAIALPPLVSSAPSNVKWVNYINNNPSHPNWHCKYWKIGNEVWITCDGLSPTEAAYDPAFRATYDSIRNTKGGDSLFIEASSLMDISNNLTVYDTEIVHLDSLINGMEVHDYIYDPSSIPCVTFTGAQYMSVVNNANLGQIAPRESLLVASWNKFDKSGQLKIIEDEWGDWFEPLNKSTDGWMQQITLLDALSAAEQLHVFMKHADRVQAACVAQGVNVIQSLFLTNSYSTTLPIDSGANARLVYTPTYYIYKMFMPHHAAGAKWAPNSLSTATLGGVALLSAGTTVDTLGHVNISISNIDTVKADTVHINLTASPSSYTITSAQIITGPAKNSYNDFGATENVNIQTFAASNYSMPTGTTATVVMPKMSVVMLQLTPTSTAVKQHANLLKPSEKMFSITAGLNGMVSITSSAQQSKPVTISLYGTDGRLLDREVKSFSSQTNSVVLKNRLTNGVYMITVANANGSFSKNIVIAR